MEYMIFYKGLASTPDSIGLKCLTTNEIICEIQTSCKSGKETRKKFQKYKTLLNNKFSSLLN